MLSDQVGVLARAMSGRLSRWMLPTAVGVLLTIGIVLSGCGPSEGLKAAPPSLPAQSANPTRQATVPAATATVAMQISQAKLPPPSPTLISTVTPTQTPLPTLTPTATHTPSPTATATPIGPCDQRMPDGELTTLVTFEYGLSRDFVPADLVSLSDYFSPDITLGYPNEIRRIVIESLVEMIADMKAAGLQPKIISAYRSYSAQAIAWNKWLRQEGQRATILSAPPGFSEHQLGTTIDLGSPELPEIVGEEDIEFHTYFYMTSESKWLVENAHRYGFTLSYPREAFDLTGFYYEPWHYRYVGADLATKLKAEGLFLAQYLLENQPIPCIP